MFNIKKHFKKNNHWFSFGFLMLLTLAVVYLFLKVEALDYDIDRQLNEPRINHTFTQKQYQKKCERDYQRKGSPLIVPPIPAGVIVPPDYNFETNK